MIVIQNMDLPQTCGQCQLVNLDLEFCPVSKKYVDALGNCEKRDNDCQLSELYDLTVLGYNMRDLLAFAIACHEHGVDEHDMKAFANNCEWALKVISDEQRKAFEEAWKKSFGGILRVEDIP